MSLNQLSRMAAGVVPALEAVSARRAALAREVAALEKAGVIEAHVFWNKDKYLYLSYPMRHGQRKREYVGADQARIAETMAKVARYKKYSELKQVIASIDLAFERARRALKEFYCALDGLK